MLNDFYTHLGPIICVWLASFLQSVTGFGLVVVAAPLLMFFYDAKLTIVLMLILAACGNAAQSILLRRDAQYRTVGELILGSWLGQPIGFFIYSLFPADNLKLLVSTAVIISLLLMQLSKRRIEECRRNTFICGLLSGIMAMTTGMAGPPLAMYFAYTAMEPRVQRATLVTFFCISNISSVITFLLGGVDPSPALAEIRYLLPALAVGILCGHLSFRYVPAKLFRNLIFAILYFTCLYTIFTVLRG